MVEKERTATEIYKSNNKKAKILKILAPIVFWASIVLSFICIVFAIRGSVGNLRELLQLLDNDKYTATQLEANYNSLIAKYGEWIIGSGGSGFTIRFINIKQVAFSGFVLINFFSSIFFLAFAFIMGKWILPKLASHIEQGNQDMVNLKILEDKEKKE